MGARALRPLRLKGNSLRRLVVVLLQWTVHLAQLSERDGPRGSESEGELVLVGPGRRSLGCPSVPECEGVTPEEDFARPLCAGIRDEARRSRWCPLSYKCIILCMTEETDFEVMGFFPADHAVASEGKVYVNGGFWDTLRFPTYPHTIAFSLVAVVRVPYRAYHQDHNFELTLEDADGATMPLRIGGSFRVGSEPHMRVGDPTTMPIAANVAQFTFEKPGDFAFVLSIDGTPLARYAIRAVQFAVPGLPGGSGAEKGTPDEEEPD